MRLLLFLFVLLSSSLAEGHWDVEYWQFFEHLQYKKGRLKFYAAGMLRLDSDITRPYFYRITENLSYEACKNMDFEFHYSCIYSRPEEGNHFSFRHRLEFEVNPSLTCLNGIYFHWRNRLELSKRQHENPVSKTLRHRSRILIPLKNLGKITTFECSDEIFFDMDEAKFSQNRFIPFGLNIDLTRKKTLFTFVMVRNFISEGDWHRSIVIGTNYRF